MTATKNTANFDKATALLAAALAALLAIASAASAQQPPDPGALADVIGDFDLGIALHGEEDAFPLMETIGPYTVEFRGASAPEKPPFRAAIQVGNAARCLIAYQNHCIISGHKLTVE